MKDRLNRRLWLATLILFLSLAWPGQIPAAGTEKDQADGQLIDGERVIYLSQTESPGTIQVFRGDTVKIIIKKIDFPYSIHIPEFEISTQAVVGQPLEITFKAKDIGVFPIFCNGKCPLGAGDRYGRIVVMQYQAAEGAQYAELDSGQARDLIEKNKPLLLDVRTPNEFYQGHLKNAKLIPVQQLNDRINEIQAYKNKEILIYCRSGNRSTVAAAIMEKHGFTKLFNLRHGIKEWVKMGYPVEP